MEQKTGVSFRVPLLLIGLLGGLFAHAEAPLIPANTPRTGKSLADCYLAALKRSETIGVQDELLVQADTLEKQAVGSVLPNINAVGTYLRQEPVNSSSGASIFPAEQTTVKLTATQPLFQGFREFAALRQRKAQVDVQKYSLQDAARQLFYDTATAYYNLLALQSDEAHYLGEIEVNQKRLRELEGFMRIGRSRLSEVLTQRSTISSLQAQLELTRGQIESAKEVLAFLTGFNRDTPVKDEDETPPAKLGPVSRYLAAIEQRPDVRAAAQNVKAFEENVPIARGQHLPSIMLSGDYYFKRPGLQKESNWDAQITGTLNIFQGGAIQAQVREAVSQQRQYELLLSRARRSAEQEIRQFYDSFSSDIKQLDKLDETATLAEKNYQAQLKEYRNGLVTNLEVLQAITTWQAALRTAARQRHFMKSDYAKLQAATAQRKEIYIESKRLD